MYEIIAALDKKRKIEMWEAIIMAILTFFTSKKMGASDSQALLAAGLAGAGTYYVATETEWGKENLNWFEGAKDTTSVSNEPLRDAKGNVVRDGAGNVVNRVIGSTADVLKSWGGAGTAAVIGTTAVATDSSLSKYLPWLLAAGVFLLLSK